MPTCDIAVACLRLAETQSIRHPVRSRQFKTPHPITRTAGVNVKEWGADAAVFLPTRPGLKEEGKTNGPEGE